MFVRGARWLLAQGFASNAPVLLKGCNFGSEAETPLKFSQGADEETAELLRLTIPGSSDPELQRQTWSEPFFFIPSCSSTCQSFTELIFYHRCHNQSIFSPETSGWHFPSFWPRLGNNTDVFFTFPTPPLMLATLSGPSALAYGLIPACYLGLYVMSQSWMAGLIRLEGRAFFLPSLPLLPSSHPKTDSRVDTSEGIKLMWWQSHLQGNFKRQALASGE